MSILVAGNPILDLVATLDDSWLQKFNILEGGYTEYNEAKHGAIYDELVNMADTAFIPGGAGQNTARVAQALLPQAKSVTYMGAVGADKYAEIMGAKAEEAGLEVCYELRPEAGTGKSGVVVNRRTRDRSMCTHLGAANYFSNEFLRQHWAKVEKADILFSAGFFVTASPESLMQLAEHAAQSTTKLWGTNLCAPFIVETYTSALLKWLQMANYVVGNELEWAAVHRVLKDSLQLKAELSVAEIVATLCDKIEWTGHPDKLRAFIATQGPDPTVVAWRSNKSAPAVCDSYPVQPVPSELVADTIGCGDAFIGGLLAGFARKWPLEKCVELANVCGRELLQNEGAAFDLSSYKLEEENADLAAGGSPN
eukprot:Gregarina_sp_Pseudo_9__310@NODE_11_length_6581_cov_205_655304_g9_i0_p3_GENE_NODE_11_length_6581_cov_205_655304_g9_i0NODE_11_length_6581_cov_205_655304_g9_i0_p3_ORF_typecomplete_len367_score129_43PfkB/PF00294_24/2_5e47_NODE_11_length_6581_cov_205_655304_g9_i049206020